MKGGFDLNRTWVPLNPRPTVLNFNPVNTNSSPNVTFPYGRNVTYIEGQGQPGNATTYTFTPAAGETFTMTPGSPSYTFATGNYTTEQIYTSTPGTYTPGNWSDYSVVYGSVAYDPGNGQQYTFGVGSYYETGVGSCPATIDYNDYTMATYYYVNYDNCTSNPGSNTDAYTFATGNYNTPSQIYTFTEATNTNYTYTPATNASYTVTPGSAGSNSNILGIPFPGGAANTAAPTVTANKINYYIYPDNATHNFTVLKDSNITIKIY